MSYFIKIGNFYHNGTNYEDRCLFARNDDKYGGIESEELPWEGTTNNSFDYKALYTEEEFSLTSPDGEETATETVKHYTGEFVLDKITLPTAEALPTAEERLEALEAVMLEMMEG